MKTIEIEIEMMKYFGIRENLIVPNVWWGIEGLDHECDLVRLTQANYATEIEIKVSKADLLKDKEKLHGHRSKYFKYLYFAVPEKLQDIALKEIPEHAGLFVVKRQYKTNNEFLWNDVVKIKKAKSKGYYIQWTSIQRQKLAELAAMRILGLKQNILKLKNEKK